MFTPIAQNRCLEFFGIFKDGNGMVIDDPELIAKGSGREIARVKAGGKVKVSIHTTQRNFERHGYLSETIKK